MSDSGNYIRTSSGVWRPAEPAGPVKSPPTSRPSGLGRVPSRGLPQEPGERARVLAEQARADLLKEQWASAETNLRLALTFTPADAQLTAELKAVVEVREQQRRAKNKP